MEWKDFVTKTSLERVSIDDQTGEQYKMESEAIWDIIAAALSLLYLVVMLLFCTWLLIDICFGRNLLQKLGFPNIANWLDSPSCRVTVFAVLGGSFGGIANGLRTIIIWHADRKAFGWRHLSRCISLPFLGAVLAAMVYSITRGGISALGGNFATSENFTKEAASAFAIGSLSGYGCRQVFIWLNRQVDRLLKIPPETKKIKADLEEKTQKEDG